MAQIRSTCKSLVLKDHQVPRRAIRPHTAIPYSAPNKGLLSALQSLIARPGSKVC